jgi:tyrosyl-tRNA synthetase
MINILVALELAQLVSSHSEAKRLIQQKGVSVDSNIVENNDYEFDISSERLLRVGKKFKKIKLK